MSEDNKVDMTTISIQPNMVSMTDKSMLEEGDRLFYELGTKRNLKLEYGDNWIRSGQFKEIKNPIDFIKRDPLINEAQYLKHHNFMIIKGDKPQYTPGTFSKESVDEALKKHKQSPIQIMGDDMREEVHNRLVDEVNRKPVGLKPLWLNKEARYNEIKEAIDRYNAAMLHIPTEWTDELQETEEWIRNWRAKNKTKK